MKASIWFDAVVHGGVHALLCLGKVKPPQEKKLRSLPKAGRASKLFGSQWLGCGSIIMMSVGVASPLGDPFTQATLETTEGQNLSGLQAAIWTPPSSKVSGPLRKQNLH